MSRTGDRSPLDIERWRVLVDRDGDDFETDIKDLRLKVDSEIFVQVNQYIDAKLAPVTRDVSDVKETSKWMLRTLMGLLISVVILLGTVIATSLAR